MSTINCTSDAAGLKQLQVLSEVSMRVLKLAQNQGQATAQMVTDNMEELQAAISQVAESLGENTDTYA